MFYGETEAHSGGMGRGTSLQCRDWTLKERVFNCSSPGGPAPSGTPGEPGEQTWASEHRWWTIKGARRGNGINLWAIFSVPCFHWLTPQTLRRPPGKDDYYLFGHLFQIYFYFLLRNFQVFKSRENSEQCGFNNHHILAALVSSPPTPSFPGTC